MGDNITLSAADGHEFGAYQAVPAGESLGGVVVLQEIFGVNRHIRSVCDRLAAAGYRALAPALFDRRERGFESGYGAEEVAYAKRFLVDLDWPAMVLDTAAAVDHLRPHGPVALMGFCLGGSLAYLSALQVPGIAAVVAYYGSQIVKHADRAPNCPTLLHFGSLDPSIPMSDVDRIRQLRPDCELYTYEAGHGFNCDERAAYQAESAALAWRRSLATLGKGFGRG